MGFTCTLRTGRKRREPRTISQARPGDPREGTHGHHVPPRGESRVVVYGIAGGADNDGWELKRAFADIAGGGIRGVDEEFSESQALDDLLVDRGGTKGVFRVYRSIGRNRSTDPAIIFLA